MGKRYYCDYCDKSFADNPVSRKTHLTGVVHLRNKKAHYDALRDEEEILADDQNKRPCKMFLSTGECRFGDRCQYSHLTHEDRARLSEIVRQKREKELKVDTSSNSRSDLRACLSEWTEKRVKRQKLQSCEEKIPKVKNDVPSYKLADCLSAFTDLPSSLLPPTRQAILLSDYPEWGPNFKM